MMQQGVVIIIDLIVLFGLSVLAVVVSFYSISFSLF
jgi:hypothetical protein